MGTLYLVATPIGNLQDIPPSVKITLEQVLAIYAEDTRHTGLLLKHVGIKVPYLFSFHEHNELQRIPEVLKFLSGPENADVALVCDAGMPTISDPGYKLVREAAKAGHKVVAIPGPNAALLALVVSGLPTDRFTFLGFLPKKDSAKRKVLEEVKDLRSTLLIYESPFRVVETLQTIKSVLGDRAVSVSRELTKLHEETIRGSIDEVINSLGQGKKGEFVIVIGSRDAGKELEPLASEG